MIINLQELIALLPFLVLLLAVVIVIISISYNRNHFFVAFLSVFSLIISLFSLYFLISIVPINITSLFHITRRSILYISMIIISSIATCVFAYPWLLKYAFNKEEFYLLTLLSTLGAIFLTVSNHMSSVFINIELMSLPIFGLIAYSNFQKYSLEASLKYLILSGVSSSFLLLGISWVYAISGDLSLLCINQIFSDLSNSEKMIVLFGIIMILMSFFFKLSLVPFHLWIADIYQGTPASVLSFFSVSGKIAIFSVLLYFFSYFSIFDHKIIFLIFSLISFFSILFGNLMAIFQNNIKRFFGYSSISQLGYLLITLLVSKNEYFFSLQTSGIFLFNYLFINIAYFGVINLFSSTYDHDIDSIHLYKGLFWSQPLLATIVTIVLFSLGGIPITLGFFGKFCVFSIIIKNHFWALGFSFLIGTILGLYGYLRLIVNMYLNPSEELFFNNIKVSRFWLFTPSGVLIFISGIMLLILGIYPNPLINLINLAQ
ncbi:NADH-quinone oxidoreductase subunit N [Buchnera aphidicola (Rhopalosiphum padi)]|uniref:NADH-quinone oxidoreductase subunit N n=1 Tax=Buchnera aphidicola subsp. Rhopalosiphum padi TaxID=98793 RepID=A0A4D6YGI8_BUCRP|nr:NADH-quinone oxidoreductase subunit N [Buchnera aphidicola]QCI24820.1 NADH-quinone oxidoreductase subunit N [Buchnera aphidicola (Rhopalosiphum padi)]